MLTRKFGSLYYDVINGFGNGSILHIIEVSFIFRIYIPLRFYYQDHDGSLIPVYLPTASPEFMVLEECWNISKSDLLVLTYYTSFRDFRMKIGQDFRTSASNSTCIST